MCTLGRFGKWVEPAVVAFFTYSCTAMVRNRSSPSNVGSKFILAPSQLQVMVPAQWPAFRAFSVAKAID
jgi:hypothetical protein